ncbi:DUF6518 family protein [Kribbella sp. NPDC051620]|uniref:DUF6518 family protein n=1 Tax=Kribbella sp. NPDC051620 TaxID=3364120 RepID=UPI0037916C06
MRFLSLVFVGLAYCGLTGFFGGRADWVETMAGSFIPYLAIPFAIGFLVPGSRPRVIAGAAAGASTSFLMVVVFNIGSALSSPYPLSMWGVYFWSIAALVSGAVFGIASRLLAGTTFRNPAAWTAGYCGLLVLAQAAVLLTRTRLDGLDLVALGAGLVIFCAVVALAIRSGRASLQLSPAMAVPH